MRLHSAVRTALTLGVLLVLVLLATVWGVAKLTDPLPPLGGSAASPSVCQPRQVAKGAVVRPPQVVVSVYNAGESNGLATRILNDLQRRGFAAGTAGNAPDGLTVSRPQVWSSSPTDPGALLVASWLGTTPTRPQVASLGSGVVVVVGNRAALTPGRAAVVAAADASVCGPLT